MASSLYPMLLTNGITPVDASFGVNYCGTLIFTDVGW